MYDRLKHSLATAFLVLGIGSQTLAQDTSCDVQCNIDQLKQDLKSIRDDLQLIKQLLVQRQGQPSPPEAKVRDVDIDLGKNPVLGSKSASLIMVEFTDYQCEFCARHATTVFPEILKKYIDAGKLRYAVIDKPIGIHPLAPKAAEASHCAEEQGKFWEMHERMMSKQSALGDLNSLAAGLGLDVAQFEACLKDQKYTESVKNDISLAAKLNIAGVPGFVLARGDDKSAVVKGISFIRGAQPLENFQREIDQALANVKN